jgi:hypothetical protein
MMLSGSRRSGGGVIGKDWIFTDPRPRFNILGGQPAYTICRPANDQIGRQRPYRQAKP